MSEPFIGEIRAFGFNFPPKHWALCNGQLLPINQNQALFSLLGTMYGGNGQTNFALPNLQSRVPLHMDTVIPQGSIGGRATTTLTIANLPKHNHQLNASTVIATNRTPAGSILATPETDLLYSAEPPNTYISAAVVPAGGGLPYDTHQPYLVINFCIALQGIFPSRN